MLIDDRRLKDVPIDISLPPTAEAIDSTCSGP